MRPTRALIILFAACFWCGAALADSFPLHESTDAIPAGCVRSDERDFVQLEWESTEDVHKALSGEAQSLGATDIWLISGEPGEDGLPRKLRVAFFRCEQEGPQPLTPPRAEVTGMAFSYDWLIPKSLILDLGVGIQPIDYMGKIRDEITAITGNAPAIRTPPDVVFGIYWYAGKDKERMIGVDVDLNVDGLGTFNSRSYKIEAGYVGIRNYWFSDGASHSGWVTSIGGGVGLAEVFYNPLSDPATEVDEYIRAGLGARAGYGYAFKLGNPLRLTIMGDLGVDTTFDSITAHGAVQLRLTYRLI